MKRVKTKWAVGAALVALPLGAVPAVAGVWSSVNTEGDGTVKAVRQPAPGGDQTSGILGGSGSSDVEAKAMRQSAPGKQAGQTPGALKGGQNGTKHTDVGSAQAGGKQKPGASRDQGSQLEAGQILKPGQYLRSGNGKYFLVQQKEGNLVLYNSDKEALWTTPTSGQAGAHAALQTEGNLVIYSGEEALWTTNTAGNAGAYLKLQNDGNLVIYSASGEFLWSRHAYVGTLPSGHTLKPGQWVQSPNGQYKAIMQEEGNLVLYNAAHEPIFSTPTAGHPGAYAMMQEQGNLVIYDDGKALWTTDTAGNPGAYLAVQDAGNAVIYSADNKPLISTDMLK